MVDRPSEATEDLALMRILCRMRILVISNLYPPVVRGGYELECSYVVNSLRRDHEVLVLTSDVERDSLDQAPGVLRDLPYVQPGFRGSLRAPGLALKGVRVMQRVLSEFEPEFTYVWNGTQIPHAALRVLDAAELPLAYRVCEHWFGNLYSTDQFMRHLWHRDRGLHAVWAIWARAVNRHPALRLELDSQARVAISWNSRFMQSRVPVPSTFVPVYEQVTFPITPQCDCLGGMPRQPLSERTVAFVGRLCWEKGPEIACRAAAALRAQHGIEVRLVLAGDVEPAMRERLARIARDSQTHVEMPGRLGPADVADLLLSAHALVMPAMWEEPLPMTAIEGALARVPVVAARTGGIPEVLHENEHALFFEMGNASACADALAETLTNRAETEARVERAFEHCRQFSYASYEKATRHFIHAAMAAFATSYAATAPESVPQAAVQ